MCSLRVLVKHLNGIALERAERSILSYDTMRYPCGETLRPSTSNLLNLLKRPIRRPTLYSLNLSIRDRSPFSPKPCYSSLEGNSLSCLGISGLWASYFSLSTRVGLSSFSWLTLNVTSQSRLRGFKQGIKCGRGLAHRVATSVGFAACRVRGRWSAVAIITFRSAISGRDLSLEKRQRFRYNRILPTRSRLLNIVPVTESVSWHLN